MEMRVFKHACAHTLKINSMFVKLFKRDYVQSVLQETLKSNIHPYQQIHPWKSLTEFSKKLVDNVIYNNDGLVAINKPYGISLERVKVHKSNHFVPNNVQYTINDALPYIAKELNFSTLTVLQKPEKYMTGVMLLAANQVVGRKATRALRRNNNIQTYWVITTPIPKQTEGIRNLAMQWKSNPKGGMERMIEITPRTSKNMYKQDGVKVLTIGFKVLRNSTNNLSSLIEITSTTNKNHAVRLFASTYLYSPVLGDSLYGSRIKQIGNTYIKVDPFLTVPHQPQVLNKQIYKLLNVKESQKQIIPVHIHLRSSSLISYLKNKETLTINAPVIPPFEWAYQKLRLEDSMENR